MISNDPADDIEALLAEAMETEFFGPSADSFQIIDPIQQVVIDIHEPKVVKRWVDLEDHKIQNLDDNQVAEALVKIKGEKEEEEISKKINSFSDNSDLIDEVSAVFSSLDITDYNKINQIDEMKADIITEAADAIAALSLSTKNELDFDDLAVFNEKGEIIVEDFSLFEFFNRYLAVKEEFHEKRVAGLENFIMPCSLENSSVLNE